MPRTAIRPSPDPSAPEMPADKFAAHIVDRLGLQACRFESFPFDRQLPRLEPQRVVLPAHEPGVQPLAAWRPEDGIELAVRFRQHMLGRFVLESASRDGVSFDQRLLAHAIATQVALALSAPQPGREAHG